jgi:hypothetical protein
MYTSNKVMQVCVITKLKIKTYKRKNYSFIIILIIRLIQTQSRVVSTRVVSGPLNTCREYAIPLHTTKSIENTNVQKMDLFVAARAIFSYMAAVTITGDRAANLGLCSALRAFEQGGVFVVPHLLRHGASVCTVSSKRPTLTSHNGIRTPDARIIISFRPTL